MQITRGLEGVVVTETALSRVDGEAGELLIRGYAVDELAPQACFEEVLYLLWNGHLPPKEALDGIGSELAARRKLPAETCSVLRAAAERQLDPMDALRMGVATLDLGDPELSRIELNRAPLADNQRRALGLVAAMPTLAATYHRLRAGAEPVEPDPELGHAANYLYTLSGERPDSARVRALETYLNTTVDHGMNASTFAARVIASTRSDMVSAIAGAIGALKGPLHGGAPGPALDMVFALRARVAASGGSLEDETQAWVRKTVADGGRIMGFGHRVYRVRDPRADVLGAAVELLFEKESGSDLYRDARAVEAVVIRVLGELKPERRLQTNVEFYTALLLYGLGLPVEVFTPTFAVSRVAGWTAHLLEQIEEDRLIRPRVAYAGPRDRRFVPVDGRSEDGRSPDS